MSPRSEINLHGNNAFSLVINAREVCAAAPSCLKPNPLKETSKVTTQEEGIHGSPLCSVQK